MPAGCGLFEFLAVAVEEVAVADLGGLFFCRSRRRGAQALVLLQANLVEILDSVGITGG